MMIYRDLMTFSTDIRDIDLEASNGWTPDCNGKLDYDPDIIRGSSRVWNDGDWICSIYCGDTDILSTGIMKASSVAEAKRNVENWMEEKSGIIRDAVVSAISKATK